MRRLSLTKGKFALVDDEDYDILSQSHWCARTDGTNWYAERHAKKDGRWTMLKMHREILNCPSNREVDHKDGDGLNNQKSNIRICFHRQNGANRKRQSDNQSGYKGVYVDTWHGYNYIRAAIIVSGKKIHLGRFKDFISAAIAYDNAAIKHYGEYAKLNFPQ
jgi:hypothetical protein